MKVVVKTVIELPSREEVLRRRNRETDSDKLDRVDRFLHRYEPAAQNVGTEFRARFAEALDQAFEAGRTAQRAGL